MDYVRYLAPGEKCPGGGTCIEIELAERGYVSRHSIAYLVPPRVDDFEAVYSTLNEAIADGLSRSRRLGLPYVFVRKQ